jgi:shikimate 5-dehydrogenase
MFDLSGKVAVVTGCNTGLGQGMALALAQAGGDIVGLNIVPADETAKAAKQMGRRFQDIATDLSTAKAEDLIARATAAPRDPARPHSEILRQDKIVADLVARGRHWRTVASDRRENGGTVGSLALPVDKIRRRYPSQHKALLLENPHHRTSPNRG